MMLKIAAILNFTLAAAHIACLPWLEFAFRIYGIDSMMDQIATHGAVLPYLITLIVALCFALGGAYALSAAGVIRQLPLLRLGVFGVAALFLLRAGSGIYWIVAHGDAPIVDLTSILVAGAIGVLYLLGGVFEYAPQPRKMISF